MLRACQISISHGRKVIFSIIHPVSDAIGYHDVPYYTDGLKISFRLFKCPFYTSTQSFGLDNEMAIFWATR